jgi:hypothetical protein
MEFTISRSGTYQFLSFNFVVISPVPAGKYLGLSLGVQRATVSPRATTYLAASEPGYHAQ